MIYLRRPRSSFGQKQANANCSTTNIQFGERVLLDLRTPLPHENQNIMLRRESIKLSGTEWLCSHTVSMGQ